MKLLFALSLLAISFSCIKEDSSSTSQTSNQSQQVVYPSVSAEMRTNFSEDWDNWRFYIGDTTAQVITAFSEDWDNWDLSAAGIQADIFTNFSNDWDNWKLSNGDYVITMTTSFSEDWDNWDINDNANGWHADVTTSFSEDWDNWDVNDNGHILDIQTAFSEDFDNWDVYGDFPSSYPLEYRVAILFVPVIVNVLIIQGIIP